MTNWSHRVTSISVIEILIHRLRKSRHWAYAQFWALHGDMGRVKMRILRKQSHPLFLALPAKDDAFLYTPASPP